MPTLSTIINIEYYAIFYFTCILLSERALAGPKQYLIYTFSCFILWLNLSSWLIQN